MYEMKEHPHFNEEHARHAVGMMHNEDGSKGPHWTVEETTSIANQLGINLTSEKHNKWDWYVAMNMIYSDFYKAVVAMTGSANTKYFAELAKAWISDKDAPDGKMWYYYLHVMCEGIPEYKLYEEIHEHREAGNARRMGRYNYPRMTDYDYSRTGKYIDFDYERDFIEDEHDGRERRGGSIRRF